MARPPNQFAVLYTPEQIHQHLVDSARWVERAILKLHQYQTQDEQETRTTVERNGCGFSSVDADFGSKLARWLLDGHKFTPRQLAVARKIALKYTKQLTAIANQSGCDGKTVGTTAVTTPTTVSVPTTSTTVKEN